MPGMNTGLEGLRRKYDTAVFEKHVLENGIAVWLQKPPILTGYQGMVSAFLPRIGSRLDPPGSEGAAHFFEHLPFRGTMGRPSKLALISPLDALGGGANAQTAPEFTRHFAWAPFEGFEVAVETVFEMAARAVVTEEHVALERGAIEQEYRDRHTSGNGLLTMYLFQKYFGAHALGHLPIGTPDSIRAMTKDTLVDFRRRYYHPRNLHIVCGGSFATADALLRVERIFGMMGDELEPWQPIETARAPLSHSGLGTATDPSLGCDSLFLAYPLERIGLYGTRWSSLEFLADVLSKGLTSPLFQELREKRSLVYRVNTYLIYYQDIVFFVLYTPTESRNFGEVREIFKSTLAQLTPEFVVKRQREWQIERRSLFQEPLEACHSLVGDVTVWGEPISHTVGEEVRDAITVDEVFGWRNYLLDTHPFTFEARAK